MAFTIAHMAAALPFFRSHSKNYSLRWLQFDALLIGTMMPDLPYFIGNMGYIGNVDSVPDLSHQWLGVLTYNLPMGLVIFALWYWGLKSAFIALIEPFIRDFGTNRCNPLYVSCNKNIYDAQHQTIGYADSYWSAVIVKKWQMRWLGSFFLPVVFALILGAATHLIWDGITHADGFIARHIDWLQYRLYIYPFNGTRVARFLQYLSSVVGLGALLWFTKSRLQIWRYNIYNSKEQIVLLNELKPLLTKNYSVLIMSTLIMLSLICGLLLVWKWFPLMITNPYTFAAKVLVSLLRCIAILFVCYTIIYHLIRHTYLSRNKNY